MQAIKQLYRIGYGPSSSHTIAPYRFVNYFLDINGRFDSYKVYLGGSLALTAKGHGTTDIINKALDSENVEFEYDIDEHENKMIIHGCRDNEDVCWHGISLGGGAISIEEYNCGDQDEVYFEKNFSEIKESLLKYGCSLTEYIYIKEPDLRDHLKKIIKQICLTVENGLNNEGLLNADLNYYRVAKRLYEKANKDNDYLIAYSYATCEENASGNIVVTAPTLGACGILSSLIYFLKKHKNVSDDNLCDILAVAGMFGNVIKNNASIAGSTGGCQAEVGTACSMAAAGIAYYYGLDLKYIEYAAEMGIEHHLGLTCDPVMGYVIIPCIERNAVGTLRAFECAYLAKQLVGIKDNAVSFDSVVDTMKYTGNKLALELKETSLGGLALEFKNE